MEAVEPTRARLLEAAYRCVARLGIERTTMEDVAREAKMSRATVYRWFPGGRDEVISATIVWEVDRFFDRVVGAVEGAPTLAALLEEVLVVAHREVEAHELLQLLLRTEPDRLLPELAGDSGHLLRLVAGFLAPWVDGDQLRADYLARMVLSYATTAGRWDLTSRAEVARLVATELVPDTAGGGRI